MSVLGHARAGLATGRLILRQADVATAACRRLQSRPQNPWIGAGIAIENPGCWRLRRASAAEIGLNEHDRLARQIVERKLRGRRSSSILTELIELVAGEGLAKFKSETETVGFSITESIRRDKHVLTDAERAKEEAWERKRDRAAPQFPRRQGSAAGEYGQRHSCRPCSACCGEN